MLALTCDPTSIRCSFRFVFHTNACDHHTESKRPTTMTKAALSGIDPLKDLLEDVLARLEALETKVGVTGAAPSKPAAKPAGATTLNGESFYAVLQHGRKSHVFPRFFFFSYHHV
jgi:hypothetical protein